MNTLPKENTNVLDDNWILTGNDIDEFNREITKFDKMTFSKKCYMKSIDFGDIVDGDVLSLLRPSANYEDAYNKFSDVHSKLDLNKLLDIYDKEVVKEMCENTFVLSEAKDDDDFIENQPIIPISVLAMNSIKQRVKILGYGFDNYKHLRNLCLAANFNSNETVTVVTREDFNKTLPNGHHPSKVFAVMSEQYRFISQTVMTTIYNSLKNDGKDLGLGDIKCVNWQIGHSITKLFIEFPESSQKIRETYETANEKDLDLSVGILIEASDIGTSAFRISGYVRFNDTNNIVYLDKEFKQIHKGNLSLSEVLKTIKEDIYPEFSYIPTRLSELLKLDIANGKSEKEKTDTISKLFKKVIKHMELKNIFGKKRTSELTDNLISTINPNENYTAYDIAMTMLSICKTMKINDNILESFSKNALLALKFDYNNFL